VTRKKMIDAWAAWMTGCILFPRCTSVPTWAFFWTFTFREEVSPQSAYTALRRWLRQVAEQVGAHVRFVYCLERQQRGVIHFHLLHDLPPEAPFRCADLRDVVANVASQRRQCRWTALRLGARVGRCELHRQGRRGGRERRLPSAGPSVQAESSGPVLPLVPWLVVEGSRALELGPRASFAWRLLTYGRTDRDLS